MRNNVALIIFIVLTLICLILYTAKMPTENFFLSNKKSQDPAESYQKLFDNKIQMINRSLDSLIMKQSRIEGKIDKLSKLSEILDFVKSLPMKERRVFSQNKEDGVLEAIFNYIKPKSKYFVEFGVESGVQCNTRYLREKLNWRGLLMDGNNSNSTINFHKELIYPNNIVSLFQKYHVPNSFDLFSEDTDLKDFWIIKNVLDAGYRPRVIVSEVNTFLGATAAITVPLESSKTKWDGYSQYFGYSVGAGYLLAQKYDYSMIYCESAAVNCFYVINGAAGFGENIKLSDHISQESLWRSPNKKLFHKKDPLNRSFTDVTGVLFHGATSDKSVAL